MHVDPMYTHCSGKTRKKAMTSFIYVRRWASKANSVHQQHIQRHADADAKDGGAGKQAASTVLFWASRIFGTPGWPHYHIICHEEGSLIMYILYRWPVLHAPRLPCHPAPLKRRWQGRKARCAQAMPAHHATHVLCGSQHASCTVCAALFCPMPTCAYR